VTQPPADPLVGRTVAHYEILARIGGGGMGVVYRARDTRLERTVALKFLPQQWSHDETAKQRFIREARAASATDHPNICTIHDIDTGPDGQLFIVMAYYEGQTLKRRLEHGPLPLYEALDIATQVADGLAKAHGRGIVHRDIKPGNVMLTEDGVRIVDFGLATFADALQLTGANATLGTAAYMSPEQVRGEVVDARTDVWAAGVVLYEMLAGHPPFRGTHGEAIAYAIRNDPPVPLRARLPDVTEDVEHVVFRALHKDTAVRYPRGRELARALRQARGLTVPIDLRTQVVPVPAAPSGDRTARSPWRRRAGVGATAGLALMLTGGAWLMMPVDPVRVAVAPVSNQSGYDEFDPYRMALTQELIAQLARSDTLRVVQYDRTLQIVRRFGGTGTESGTDAVQALAAETGAPVVLAPVLLYDGGWRASVVVRDAGTALPRASVGTEPVVTELRKDAVYRSMATLADRLDEYFRSVGPRRASVAEWIRARVSRGRRPRTPTLRTLDAALEFERGIERYDRQEYEAARQRFAAAAAEDARSALVAAWRARAAQVVRLDDEAAEAGAEARSLLLATAPGTERLFVEAVADESARDHAAAEERYRALTEAYPDEPAWHLELAAFFDRRFRNDDAILAYQRALAVDGRLALPDLELCRLYRRTSDAAKALEHARRALRKYTALGDGGGEALVRLCMADTMRDGSGEQLEEARRHAEAAAARLQELGLLYNLPRAHSYLGVIAALRRSDDEAIAMSEMALEGARDAGNRVLESVVLMNLGVTNARMRRRTPALRYYRESEKLSEALGDDLRVAQVRLNAGAMLIEYGGDLEEGLRDVQRAMEVFRNLRDRRFEVSCLQAIATYHLYRGAFADAERELNRAISLAREQKREEVLPSLTIYRALVRLDAGEYVEASALLEKTIGDGTGQDSPRARIHLGRVRGRMGDFDAAMAHLTRAAGEVKAQGRTGLLPMLHLALGEVAYERGSIREGRVEFERAASFWTSELPDPASVEARGYVAYLDALDGRAGGRPRLHSVVEEAARMGLKAMDARLRLLAAHLDLASRQDSVLTSLDALAPDAESGTIGLDLGGQVRYWRGFALARRAEGPSAQAEIDAGRRMLESVRTSLPPPLQASFGLRWDIRDIVGPGVRGGAAGR
jgi:tetratricopeptide (TPR) repeat protein/tRNA A-37 threonylcarbamoyl transferase component Bud32